MKLFRTAAVMVAAAAGTVFVGPTAPAAAAVSGERIQYVGATATGTFGQHLNVTAMCVSGRKVVSLGAFGTTITSLRPTPNLDGATVTAIVAFGSSVTVIAGCVDPADVAGVLHVELRIHGKVGGFRDGVQRCPAAMYAFGGGGGFTSADSNGMSADVVTSDGTGWEYAGMAFHSDDSTEVDLQCLPNDGTTFLVSAGVAGTGLLQTVRAVCPAPYFAYSGGAYTANPDGSPAANGFVIESQPTNGATWEVTGAAPAGGKVVAVTRCTL
jgi:hypothetical protein